MLLQMHYWRQASVNFIIGISEEMMSAKSQVSHSTRISLPPIETVASGMILVNISLLK